MASKPLCQGNPLGKRQKSQAPDRKGLLRFRLYLLNLMKSMTISMMSAMTAKMSSIPCHRIGKAACKAVNFCSSCYFKSCGARLRSFASITPAMGSNTKAASPNSMIDGYFDAEYKHR